MARFALSAVRSGAEKIETALTIDGEHYLLSKLEHNLEPRNSSIRQIVEGWPSNERVLQSLADKIKQNPSAFSDAVTPEAVLDTPLRFPNKLLAIGANYASHLAEMGLPAEKWDPMPFFICPPTTSMVGPGRTVKYPLGTTQFDWECELVVVVASKLRNASVEEASTAIAGYMIGLDLSCRDLLAPAKGGLVDIMRGKAQETMKPWRTFVRTKSVRAGP